MKTINVNISITLYNVCSVHRGDIMSTSGGGGGGGGMP